MIPAYIPTQEEREADARMDEWKRERNRKAVLAHMEREKQRKFEAAMTELLALWGTKG